jgi:sugar fermentation stimulation protein A
VIFDAPLIPGILLRRYGRFLADIRLDSGEQITAHCPNSGSMKGVALPGNPVMVSHQPAPHRRLHYTWELISLDGGWVGVNTMIPNRLAAEAFERGLIPAFRRYKHFRAEVKIADDTRIDFALGADEQCWVEVKNVTLVENRVARFPDSVTTRGAKHLQHLMAHAKRGGKSAMLYIIQHHLGDSFTTADDIDPVYGKTLRQAMRAGVKVEAWKADVSPREIVLTHNLPLEL